MKNMDIEKLNMGELIELRNRIQFRIENYSDGYLYISSVRQYGSVWEERPSNLYTLSELCGSYNGDNGIVDVYTNNPNLKFPEMEFYNYGDVMFIKSEYDYREWVKFNKSRKLIESIREQVEAWEDRDNRPFSSRPMFKPVWSKEELDDEVKEFENKTWDFVEPVSMVLNEE